MTPMAKFLANVFISNIGVQLVVGAIPLIDHSLAARFGLCLVLFPITYYLSEIADRR